MEPLALPEHSLEEHVRLRTEELLRSRNALQAALEGERLLRREQPDEDFRERRLTAALFPDEAERFALGRIERVVVDCV